MPQLFANNAFGALASPINGAATTITLVSGDGARFPNPTGGDYFHATLVGLNANGVESSWEIVRCTARATDQLTVTRGQEGTTATSWNAGTRIELRVTKAGLDGKESAGTAAAAITTHEAATDPHPQYTTTAEAAAAAPVQSVAGKTGAVTLAKADVGLGNVDNTSDATKAVLSATKLATARTIAGTSFDGQANIDISYTNLTNKPALGTAAAKDIPATGNAAATQLVLGNDSRLSDARAPTAHSHAINDVTSLQTALDGKSSTSHTHANATTAAAGFMSPADKTKLDGVATGATANATDAQLRDRSTHTGTQAISTVTELQAALEAKQATLVSGTNIKTVGGQTLLGSGDIPAGGLNYLTEVRNTTAPNATVPVHGIIATGTESNIDLVLSPKGTGALVARTPNSTSAGGGNKRGINAVDWQLQRAFAHQVASGGYSVISGGFDNAASSLCSTVGGGGNNNGGGEYSTISGGQNNTISASFSVVSGGRGNDVSNIYSVISGGISNRANGSASVIPGGRYATTNLIQGLFAYGFYGEAVGKNQMSFWGGRLETTNATATRITADAAVASVINQLTLRTKSTFRVKGTVVARNTSTNDSKEWTFEALIKRGADTSSTSIVGTPSITSTFADTAAASWSIAVTADTTNGALAITATGAEATTILWTAVVHSIEVA